MSTPPGCWPPPPRPCSCGTASCSYPDLAEDIATEARLALALCTEIRDLDTKLAALLHQADPAAIMTSVPGVGAHQRRPDPGPPRRPRPVPVPGRSPLLHRPGPLPDRLRHQRPPRAADQIRRRPAARGPVHGRQRSPPHRPHPRRPLPPAHGHQGKHHNSALCHISTALLTRIIACWRAGTPYQIRDTDGTPLTTAQGRAIIAERYQVSDELRAQRRTSHTKTGTSRRHQESPGAPTPARPRTTLRPPAETLDTA